MTEPDAGGNLRAGALVRSARRLAEARWFLLALALFIAAMVGTEFGLDAGAFGLMNSIMAIGSLAGEFWWRICRFSRFGHQS